LLSLGLPTNFPNIITGRSEREVRKAVNGFYFEREGGWVLRCGRAPDMHDEVERGMPWDLAYSTEELIQKILAFQRDIGSNYLVFCHPQSDMIKGGIMVVEGKGVVVEAAAGGPRELSAFYRGRRDPEQRIEFRPGMFSDRQYGEGILNNSDLLDLRGIERTLIWSELGAVVDPVCLEFSRLRDNSLYVHDLSLVN
jgi:hypothetical protein